ncbi:hypothetical protein SteCoe_24882 [Stentor coeruleus]|uniref:Protein kinase domain-containing protein n=1 Tax=Stentor coeruleus TaxID=5963 RepID=A0A1R2BGG2_9CILI|nr:hypothetical protein SteCoe_24882 [Stentor coeruleus]
MGISCCKQVKVNTEGITRLIADGDKSILWIKGEKIGSGSFGTVYRAIDVHTANYFAVKCISLKSKKVNSPKLIKLIQKEVNILKSLEHPNIIKYYQTDLDIESNEINIIIEYASKGNLQSFVSEFKPLSNKILQKFIREILYALSYMHSKGVIHRDLKCANILISEDSSIKLSDFGLSKIIESTLIESEIAGSLNWMAPEILSNGLETNENNENFTDVKKYKGYSFPADIWSLGCTVIEMMTGSPPWTDTCKSMKEVLRAIMTQNNFPSIPNCSLDLKDFITKCFIRNPQNRVSADELLNHPFLNENCSSVVTATVTVL